MKIPISSDPLSTGKSQQTRKPWHVLVIKPKLEGAAGGLAVSKLNRLDLE